ncbi:riboflavin biosynthesis protein RibF [candidate division WOR-1 bacterium RIFOXYB2_FULL_48_7]|uniref:Riboflavin biosynthesis protein n=1 Tax=candidate division WOR-1 bacterium RIFOXYB2_FULL_48_7 TaxID=1802583 RepID=A0A1F4T8P9_UNCSA|nr:MAG: riboflavin biosynthesis protein RibF [candidate division WOR-1 bacterium RIFOXYB2_FULL_48_7]
MRVIRHPKQGKLRQPVVALGTFDGVHLGHQQVIKAAIKAAQKLGTHAAVITFDPHPQEIVAPERGLRLLTTLSEREELFASLGVDAVLVLGFSPQIQKLAYRHFVERYLVKRLGVKAVFVGYDYAFGQGRLAGISELRQLGKEFGFSVQVVNPVKVGGEIAKSAKIRDFLATGQLAKAIKMLGRPYRLTGRVVKGEGRGRQLGFPTANLAIDKRKLIPAMGVYVGYVHHGRQVSKCVVNIGSRPTFGAGELLVEVHLLGFQGKLRGQKISVGLYKRLREEKQFSDTKQLVAQIKKDIARARAAWYNQ